MLACFQVLSDSLAQNRIDVAIDVVRDLSPDLNATDLDNWHSQNGLTFLYVGLPAHQLPS